MSYRVVIPTAGIGSRLNKLTLNVNKSLVSVANRPIISHIIEQFPKTCKFVIATGHKGELVKDFLELAYPDRNFYFVNVYPYKGVGSGLGYTLLSCESYLQEPFVFTSCDSLVKERIPNLDHNWMGFASSNNLSSYRTLEIIKNKVEKIYEKRKDKSINDKAYIGLAGVYDYKTFWKAMKESKEISFEQGEVYGLKKILKKQIIRSHEFTWFDTGNPKALAATRESYQKIDDPNILEKENEAIWFVKDRVIKFSNDTKFIKNRFKRATHLKSFVPKMLHHRRYMYCYSMIAGSVISKVITLPLFNQLLDYCKFFWKKAELNQQERNNFIEKCNNFYFKKTRERIDLFYKNFEKKDRNESINGESMPTLSSLLEQVDWKDLSNGLAGRFHGDLHFENILWDPKNKIFTLLDWRQDFDGDLKIGDIYYDLAKLLHGLIVSHEQIIMKNYSIKWKDDEIFYYINRTKVLEKCELRFNQWCIENNFSLKKVKILTALIYLNISSLHHYPYSLFLYAMGKDMLKKELSKT